MFGFSFVLLINDIDVMLCSRMPGPYENQTEMMPDSRLPLQVSIEWDKRRLSDFFTKNYDWDRVAAAIWEGPHLL